MCINNICTCSIFCGFFLCEIYCEMFLLKIFVFRRRQAKLLGFYGRIRIRALKLTIAHHTRTHVHVNTDKCVQNGMINIY